MQHEPNLRCRNFKPADSESLHYYFSVRLVLLECMHIIKLSLALKPFVLNRVHIDFFFFFLAGVVIFQLAFLLATASQHSTHFCYSV